MGQMPGINANWFTLSFFVNPTFHFELFYSDSSPNTRLASLGSSMKAWTTSRQTSSSSSGRQLASRSFGSRPSIYNGSLFVLGNPNYSMVLLPSTIITNITAVPSVTAVVGALSLFVVLQWFRRTSIKDIPGPVDESSFWFGMSDLVYFALYR